MINESPAMRTQSPPQSKAQMPSAFSAVPFVPDPHLSQNACALCGCPAAMGHKYCGSVCRRSRWGNVAGTRQTVREMRLRGGTIRSIAAALGRPYGTIGFICSDLIAHGELPSRTGV